EGEDASPAEKEESAGAEGIDDRQPQRLNEADVDVIAPDPAGSNEYQKGDINWNNVNVDSNNKNYNKYSGEKKDGEGFGIASMVLGIISVIFFCSCCNPLTAVLAIVFGIIQITTYKKKGFAIAGIVTSVVAMILAVICAILVAGNASMINMSPEDLYKELIPYMEEVPQESWEELTDESWDLDLEDQLDKT
nr:DUF4190 domain-containing protein [Lachnospiraceae bacterium]